MRNRLRLEEHRTNRPRSRPLPSSLLLPLLLLLQPVLQATLCRRVFQTSVKKYSYAELKAAARPADVDPAQREAYLSDAEFASLFKCDREVFGRLPRNASSRRPRMDSFEL